MYICLECRTSRVRVPPEAALLFLWGKKELSSGVVACICLVSITDYICTSYIFLPISSTFPPSLISLLPSSSLLPTELSSRGARDEIVDILQLEPPPYCLPKDSNPPLSSFLPPSLESHFKVREKTSWQKKRIGWRGEGGAGGKGEIGGKRLGGVQ